MKSNGRRKLAACTLGLALSLCTLGLTFSLGCGGGATVGGPSGGPPPPPLPPPPPPPTSYTVAVSPGWTVDIDSKNTFIATDSSRNGFPRGFLFYSGVRGFEPSGLAKLTTTDTNNWNFDPPIIGKLIPPPRIAVEVSDVLLLNSFAGLGAAPAATCATALQERSFQYVVDTASDLTVDPAYGTLHVSPNAVTGSANTQTFLLDGSPGSAEQTLNDVVCDAGRLSGSGLQALISPDGVLVVPGRIGGLGLAVPPNPVDLTAITTVPYLGIFYRFGPVLGSYSVLPVGFDPYPGQSLAGGAFADPDHNAFSDHATDITISLADQPSNGLVNGFLTDSTGSRTRFVAVVNQVRGKWMMFGIAQGVDQFHPWMIALVQK